MENELNEIVQGNELAVSPEYLVDIEGTTNGPDYDQSKDAEALKESQRLSQLRETKTTDVAAFLKYANNNGGDLSYDSFQTSDWANDRVTPGKGWAYHVNDAVSKGLINDSIASKAISGGGGSAPAPKGAAPVASSSGKAAAKGVVSEAYERPESYDEPLSDELAQMSKKYGNAPVRSDDGSADEMFYEMYSIMNDICRMRANPRHALIYGDP